MANSLLTTMFVSLDDDIAAVRPRHCTADQQQVVLRVDLHQLLISHGRHDVAVLTRHLLAFDNAARETHWRRCRPVHDDTSSRRAWPAGRRNCAACMAPEKPRPLLMAVTSTGFTSAERVDFDLGSQPPGRRPRREFRGRTAWARNRPWRAARRQLQQRFLERLLSSLAT